MKVKVEYRPQEETEVILRGRPDSPETQRILAMLQAGIRKLWVWDEARSSCLVEPSQVVWCEVVEERTFVYTREGVYQTVLTLGELEGRWEHAGFFRCAKSTVVNLTQIQTLASCGGGRIEATLTTGERLMISRHYAPLLRERLRQE